MVVMQLGSEFSLAPIDDHEEDGRECEPCYNLHGSYLFVWGSRWSELAFEGTPASFRDFPGPVAIT